MGVAEPHRYIKVTDCVNTVTIVHETVIPPEESRIEKVDDRHYRVKSTGEIREYNERSLCKGDNRHSLLQSFNQLKMLINCTYVTPSWTKFVTLTYRENMTDNARLREDLRRFWPKLKARFGEFEYIYVKEKQGRGAWHIHSILFFPFPAPWMENKVVADCWGHGFVNVQGFKDDINNLGNYLCAYLTDGGKATKKGARLENYESGVRLFNCSRGVKRPISSRICYEDYLDFVFDENNLLLSEKNSVINCPGGQPIRVKRELYAIL